MFGAVTAGSGGVSLITSAAVFASGVIAAGFEVSTFGVITSEPAAALPAALTTPVVSERICVPGTTGSSTAAVLWAPAAGVMIVSAVFTTSVLPEGSSDP